MSNAEIKVPITLSRDEASAVAVELLEWTGPDNDITVMRDEIAVEGYDDCLLTAAAMEATSRRLRWEATIRQSGGWWGDNCPGTRDLFARHGRGSCPESFALDAEGAVALAELCADRLPAAVAWIDSLRAEGLPADTPYYCRRRAALERLADRFNIEIPQAVA